MSVDPLRSSVSEELILEPELAIIDSHHHLWLQSELDIAAMEAHESLAYRALGQTFRRHPRYLLDDLMADLRSGHNVRATVHVDAHAMYRAGGPEEMRSVGEVEFVNGVAAMAASGLFGDAKACAGIVGGVDLRLGEGVEPVLQAHLRAGGSRYRGVRSAALYDEDQCIVAGGAPHLLLDDQFRAGFARLQPYGLSFDALVLEPQLPEVIDLARAFPQTQIILNHMGCPLGTGRYTGRREQRFPLWRKNIRALATCDNVAVKLGGLGNPFGGFRSVMSTPPASSEQLAKEWQPYIETCIEAFGADRCMFESNFPVDTSVGSYAAVWNAFKRIAAGASLSQKNALFSGTAIRVYRLET